MVDETASLTASRCCWANWAGGKAVRWKIELTSGDPFGIACLWDRWTDPASGELVVSFSMLTVNADEHPVMRQFHKPGDEKRTPVIIAPELHDTWLSAEPAKTADRKPGSYPDCMATVCNLGALPASDLDALFEVTEVGEVWGVGRRISQQLRDAGVNTVLDLARLSPSMVRSRWGVVLERTVRELQGQPCIGLEEAPPAKQQIACTRSFGHPVTELSDLIEAISEFAVRAAEKLRRQSCLAGQILAFAHTSPFRPGPRFSNSIVVPLRRPTADSRSIVQSAVSGVRQIYTPGYKLSKAGVMLMDLSSDATMQCELDIEPTENRNQTKLMKAMDALNDRYGRGTVQVGSAPSRHAAREWSMRQERLTPQYTTKFSDLPIAKA